MDAVLRKRLVIWLFVVAVCVFAMIVIGGLTRLTESGLSIVEWKPVSGTFPPMTAAGWEKEFADYRTSPQYQQVNKGMTLEEFQGIFWLEYWHRVGGRVIGFVFLLPMLFFFARYRLPVWVKWRLVGIFALGGLQGAIGWYMVMSGLVDVPQVSPYRLALHLGVAFLIMGACVWVAREIAQSGGREPAGGEQAAEAYAPSAGAWLRERFSLRWVAGFAAVVAVLTFGQVLLGALVAGLDAGLTYNTFPLMDGRFVPKGLYLAEPLWRNHFENVTMVQFQHRIGAYVLTAAIVVFAPLAWAHSRSIGQRYAVAALVAVLAVQVALGIATLVQVVPVALASKHQAVAAILFALAVWIWYDFRRLARSGAAQGAPVAAGVNTKWQPVNET